MNSVIQRIPGVRSLGQVLPSGSEGGKEFARVISMLLLNYCRRTGYEFTLFDDASGDYEGLDSFARRPGTNDVVGFQYKFFPSPLSNAHRAEIISSLENALTRNKRLRLLKWIVVTPDDFKNPIARAGGGDVEWFEDLRLRYAKRIEIEHVGHSKAIELFLQAPHLCLYYYPELVPNGHDRRRSIQELRVAYHANLNRRFGRIEFVGMSVYKEEASRRVPLEDIYIPLSLLAEKSPEEDDDTPRVSPASALSRGGRTVILGDPGCGKSTLVSFLALVGKNAKLQERGAFPPDDRLPIVVTLRRYAEELKVRRNLPLLDYIVEATRADFSLAVSSDFFEYFLEAGHTILLFDGLDELGSADLRRLARERIDSFQTAYPLNTVIVTSRVVGYDGPVRFDKTFAHYRVAKLRVPEIEHFVDDWYTARIEDTKERQDNVRDLVRVIGNADSDAIRQLARNPLLLTIVALVHRIDAVLPDQRVVLYQKCTETLLNTWSKAKRREDETANGRIERHNRLRIEAIAHWMHCRSESKGARSVVRKTELSKFLTSYIAQNEHPESRGVAEDQAEAFLDFVRATAGLMIEVGEDQYSFVHLTFQEYLCATYLAAAGEMGGVEAVWKEIEERVVSPRWREVVRLLVASLRSISAQAFFVDRVLQLPPKPGGHEPLLLAMGLLRDGIEPAEARAAEIAEHCVQVLQSADDEQEASSLLMALRAWTAKSQENSETLAAVLQQFARGAVPQTRVACVLIAVACGQRASAQALAGKTLLKDPLIGRLLLNSGVAPAPTSLASLDAYANYCALLRADANAGAALMLCFSALLEGSHTASRKLFLRELCVLSVRPPGPQIDNGLNLIGICMPHVPVDEMLVKGFRLGVEVRQDHPRGRGEAIRLNLADHLLHALLGWREQHGEDDEERLRHELMLELRNRSGDPDRGRNTSERVEAELVHAAREAFLPRSHSKGASYSAMLFGSQAFRSYALSGLLPGTHDNFIHLWRESLASAHSRSLGLSISKYFDKREWDALSGRIETATEDDCFFIAWLALFDFWFVSVGAIENLADSPLASLMEQARAVDHVAVKLALALRACAEKPFQTKNEVSLLVQDSRAEVTELLLASGWPPADKLGRRLRQGPSLSSRARSRTTNVRKKSPAKKN